MSFQPEEGTASSSGSAQATAQPDHGQNQDRMLGAHPSDQEQIAVFEPMHLSKVKRTGPAYHEALRDNADLMTCLSELQNRFPAEVGIVAPFTGAKIFVEPGVLDATLKFLIDDGVTLDNGEHLRLDDLKPWHVVASSRYYPIVQEVLGRLPSPGAQQVKVSSSAVFNVPLPPTPPPIELQDGGDPTPTPVEFQGRAVATHSLIHTIELDSDGEVRDETLVTAPGQNASSSSNMALRGEMAPTCRHNLGDVGSHLLRDGLKIARGFFHVKVPTSEGASSGAKTSSTTQARAPGNDLNPRPPKKKKREVQDSQPQSLSSDLASQACSQNTAGSSQSLSHCFDTLVIEHE